MPPIQKIDRDSCDDVIHPRHAILDHLDALTDAVNGLMGEKKEERWKPKEDETYFMVEVDSEGVMTGHNIWEDDSTDLGYYDSYNCFRTREEAERTAVRVREALKQI